MPALPVLAAVAAIFPAVLAPESTFVLNVLRADSAQTVHLTCGPTGGDHPKAQAVCDALSTVDGQVDHLSNGPTACTMQYEPVKVSARGMWRGQLREFGADYSNPCVMRAETGPVFDF